jgi:cyclase
MSDLEHLSFEHFTLERLADGIYVALAGEGRGAAANAGIIALGDAALVFDTMLTAQAGADLREAAEQLTDSPVRYVINSHRHPDHVMGNSAFPADIQVISTAITRDLMQKMIPEFIRAARQNRAQWEVDLRAAQDRLASVQDPEERAALNATIKANSLQLEAASRARLRAPNWTFEQQMALYGSGRAVEIISYGPAHTESDAILWLPEERIAFVADLLFNGRHPWAGDGFPADWQHSIDCVLELEPRLVVPGHGPLATTADLIAQKAYMGMLAQHVDDALAHGLPEDEDMPIDIPAAFAHLDGPDRFTRSLKALVARAQKEP